jgi:hypothetical protein
MSYEWDYNCAIVDRLFYWEYFIRGTTLTALALTGKDLWFIRRNWYADRAMKRLPIVIISNLIIQNIIEFYSTGLFGLELILLVGGSLSILLLKRK